MKVFLSSTYVDLIEHRKAAHDALERLEQEYVLSPDPRPSANSATMTNSKSSVRLFAVKIRGWLTGDKK